MTYHCVLIGECGQPQQKEAFLKGDYKDAIMDQFIREEKEEIDFYTPNNEKIHAVIIDDDEKKADALTLGFLMSQSWNVRHNIE